MILANNKVYADDILKKIDGVYEAATAIFSEIPSEALKLVDKKDIEHKQEGLKVNNSRTLKM